MSAASTSSCTSQSSTPETFPSHLSSATLVSPCTRFELLTRDSDVRFFTGLPNIACFYLLFEHLQSHAVKITYWNSPKRTMPVPEKHRSVQHGNKKLTLEIELFMVVQRLQLGLLTEYPAHLYSCTQSMVSSIVFTQIWLMALELSFLISWTDRIQVRRNLPDVFQKYYPKCRVIIDCAEFFIETPASLNAQAFCWSDYKHYSTVKILVGITPNGSISCV